MFDLSELQLNTNHSLESKFSDIDLNNQGNANFLRAQVNN